MVNWKVRFRNKTFWTSIIPLVILTVQNMAHVFGVEVDLGDKSSEIMAAVTPLLSALALMGVVVDPTTDGIGDSARALTYDKPKSTAPTMQPAPTPAHMVDCETCEGR